MPNIYRLHIRPNGGLADTRLSFQFCLEKGLLGVGWALPNPSGRSVPWEDYLAEAGACYGTGRQLSRVKYLHDRVQPDDLIWTRDLDGYYYLARASGSWQYEDTQAAWNADVVNVVPCDIHRIGLADTVPGKVLACFRPTSSVQRIADEAVQFFSQVRWNQISGRNTYAVPPRAIDLFALLDDRATEDIVLIYLQLRGWLVLGGTRQRDTLAYEVVLVHRDDGRRAVLQVKTGEETLDPRPWGSRREQVFLFQAQDRYAAAPPDGVECIDRQEILHLVETQTRLLPDTVAVWHRFALAATQAPVPSVV